MPHSMQRPSPFRLFLQWSVLACTSSVILAISMDLGLLGQVLVSDVTRISLLILLVLLGGSLYAGYRCWWLSCQVEGMFAASGTASQSVVQTFFQAVKADHSHSERLSDSLAAEVMAERLRGNHQVGWFITGIVVKLGLLGTVVGFVLMLRSVSDIEQLDTSDIQVLMQQMTLGMGVAMNTTLVGLVSSMLLGVQYLMLDRAADQLVADAVEAATCPAEPS